MTISRVTAALFMAFALSSCGSSVGTRDGAAIGCEGRGRSRCVAKLSLGAGFACAALGDESVWCWGRNDENQLGYESSDQCPERLGSGQLRSVACHAFPQQVTSVRDAIAISAGGAHACALTAGSTLHCWGGNAYGQLGNGGSLPSVNAVAVTNGTAVTAVVAGGRHTCAIIDGRVACWGANDRGQLGVANASSACAAAGATVPCERTPTRVAGIQDVVELAAGDEHTCARTMDGRVFCWGTNVDGELGRGTADATPTTTPAPALVGTTPATRVRAISASGHHTCALRADDAVVCWGRNDRGQLGVTISSAPFAPCANACVPAPVPVLAFEAMAEEQIDSGIVADATAGDGRADAARDAARADAGDAGDAGDAAFDSGLQAPRMAKPIALATGAWHSCALLEDRTVRC